jgi:tetratricopeptide (TPR) repeat protein
MKKDQRPREEELEFEGEIESPEEEEEVSSNFIQKNSTLIIIISIVIIAGAGIGIFMQNKAEEDNLKASQMLTRVLPYLESGEYDKAINGDPEKMYGNQSVEGLEAIVSKYGGTDAGESATLLLGKSYLETGDFQKAENYFRKVENSGKKIIVKGAKAGLAATKEQAGNFKEAAALYGEAATLAEDEGTKLRYLYFEGLCLENSGDTAGAEEVYRKIIGTNPGSDMAANAKQGLYRLGMIIE